MESTNLYHIQQSKLNDRTSLEFLIRKFQPLLIKYACKLTDFEDSKSELTLHLIKTIQKIPLNKSEFTEDKYILSYISTSIKRYYIYLSSKEQTTAIKENCLFYDITTPYYDESNIIFYDLIKKLNPKEQLILERKFIYNYTNTEISRYLNLSRQNVQACLTRAITKLRK